jgi:hypothetical protein
MKTSPKTKARKKQAAIQKGCVPLSKYGKVIMDSVMDRTDEYLRRVVK